MLGERKKKKETNKERSVGIKARRKKETNKQTNKQTEQLG